MPRINVLGLGAGDIDQMPIGVYKELNQAKHLFIRTKEHPVIRELEKEGILYESFDDIYLKHDGFEEVYEEMVLMLEEQLRNKGEIHYAVPGHPIVAERTVQLLIERAQAGTYEVNIKGGQSFIDPLLARLKVDPVEGLLFLDATSLRPSTLQPQCQTIVTQVYDPLIASEVKLTLMEMYPDDYLITVATAVGMHEEEILEIPLYELDRVTSLSNLTALYIPSTKEEIIINRQYFRSREIFRQLRGPDGCPWDKEQTHQSLTKHLLEEANEVIEAIEEEDPEHLTEELGDILLHVFLHAQIAEDAGFFTMEDVLASLNEKMIRRHPHVFGDLQIDDPEELIKQWQEIKKEERKNKKE